MGVHHDPDAPLPAAIGGSGMSHLRDGEWTCLGGGGRLFMADGMFDLSYGPRDLVLLDGTHPHGVTNLKGIHHDGLEGERSELERFSLIAFSTFARGTKSRFWRSDWEDKARYL